MAVNNGSLYPGLELSYPMFPPPMHLSGKENLPSFLCYFEGFCFLQKYEADWFPCEQLKIM